MFGLRGLPLFMEDGFMTKITTKEKSGHEGAHCPFCRDTIQEGVIVQCDHCQALYHKECATSCVILGCPGHLEETSLAVKATIRLGKEGSKPVKESPTDSSGVLLYVLSGAILFCIFVTVTVMGDGKLPKGALGGLWPLFLVLILSVFQSIKGSPDEESNPTSSSPENQNPRSENSGASSISIQPRERSSESRDSTSND